MKPFLATFLLFAALPMSANEPATAAIPVAKPHTFVNEQREEMILIQQYFIVFLKSGPNRSQSKEEEDELHKRHFAYLDGLYKKGIIQLTGPTNSEGEIHGFSVYATARKEEALQLASEDPMVKAGLLVVEVHEWWLAKGSVVK